VVVDAGLAVTLAPVVAERPVAGDHVNEVDVPVAVRTVGEPAQIATFELLTVGSGFTVTVTVVVLLHVPFDPVIV